MKRREFVKRSTVAVGLIGARTQYFCPARQRRISHARINPNTRRRETTAARMGATTPFLCQTRLGSR